MVIINGRFLIHRITGVERYARELLSALDKIIMKGCVELAVPNTVKDIPHYNNINVVRVGRLNNRLWEHLSFPIYVMKKNAISLNLCNVSPLLNPGIVCIHDVKIKARPNDFKKTFLFWYTIILYNACRRAKKIITVSDFSKREIQKYYGVNGESITVIHNAWQHYMSVAFDETALNKFSLEKGKYYFSLCSLEPNKNYKWVVESALQNPDSIFAIAGSINRDVFSDGMGINFPNNIRLLGYVSDEEAKTLMRDCKAFLFPTFYEGFGIPPLEAISAGCHCVVVSDTEVMHEIFGDKVNYINPYKAGSMDFVTKDCEDILKNYSWEDSALKLNNLLQQYYE